MPRALVLLALGACHAPAPAHPHERPTATCFDRACLEAHEGQLIRLAGTHVAPIDRTRKGKHLHRLVISDGTLLVLHLERDAAARALPDGVRVSLVGRIYLGMIPERYGIVERTGDPYLLEVTIEEEAAP